MIKYDMKENSGHFEADSDEQYLVELIVINNSLIKHLVEDSQIDNKHLRSMLEDIESKYGLTIDTLIVNEALNIEIKKMDAVLNEKEKIHERI